MNIAVVLDFELLPEGGAQICGILESIPFIDNDYKIQSRTLKLENNVFSI